MGLLLTTTAPAAPPPAIALQARPLDTGPAVRRFLSHWRPDVALWVADELWPTLVSETQGAGIPMLFVDARPGVQRWRRTGPSVGRLLRGFRAVLTGTASDAALLRRAGAPPGRLEVTGFLEEGASPLDCNEADRAHLAAHFAGRPVWLAAAVEPEEVAIVSAAHAHVHRLSHRLLLILSPADLRSGPAIARALEAEGWRTALRSADEEPERDTQIYVADLPDELGLWFRLASVSFLGGTLAGGCAARASGRADAGEDDGQESPAGREGAGQAGQPAADASDAERRPSTPLPQRSDGAIAPARKGLAGMPEVDRAGVTQSGQGDAAAALRARAGRDPHQPASLGSAILHGPATAPFEHAYARLGEAGAAQLVRNADELGRAVDLLQSPDRAAAMAHAAWTVTSSGAEVTDRVRELVFAALGESPVSAPAPGSRAE